MTRHEFCDEFYFTPAVFHWKTLRRLVKSVVFLWNNWHNQKRTPEISSSDHTVVSHIFKLQILCFNLFRSFDNETCRRTREVGILHREAVKIGGQYGDAARLRGVPVLLCGWWRYTVTHIVGMSEWKFRIALNFVTTNPIAHRVGMVGFSHHSFSRENWVKGAVFLWEKTQLMGKPQ